MCHYGWISISSLVSSHISRGWLVVTFTVYGGYASPHVSVGLNLSILNWTPGIWVLGRNMN